MGFTIGHQPWNKGQKINFSIHPKMGHQNQHTEISKQKISKSKKGTEPWNKGRVVDEIEKKRLNFIGGIGRCKRWEGHIARVKQLWLNIKRHSYPEGTTSLEKKRFTNMRYKARKKEADGSHSFGEWELLKKQYGNTCPMCGITEPEIKLTEDHIIPLSKGGSDYAENIQPLCVACNTKKHTRIIRFDPLCKEEFIWKGVN